jgi:hypothetical protein
MALDAQSMATRRINAVNSVAPPQSNDSDAAQAYREAVILADCQAIIAEIVANSELVPVTTDTGTAGAGIITGKVK